MSLRAPTCDQLCWVLILIGVVLRAWLWLHNPPDNTYDGDHHQKVIRIYAEEQARPAPDRCWQCYQPPFFYALSAGVFELSSHLPWLKAHPWKGTQALNLIAAGLTLILLFYLLRLLGVRSSIRLVILSLAVILPRDLYTAAMMSNDYMLVCLTTASACVLVKLIKQVKASGVVAPGSFCILGGTVILGALTKQHGLLLLLFPLYLAVLMLRKGSRRQAFYLTGALILITGLAGSSELWLYSQTGQFLVSNQAFFDFAAGQKPGVLNKVEFTSLRLPALFDYPFLSEETRSSLPSQLFARLWFDHENRFVARDTPFVVTAGRLAYSFGLSWTIAAMLIAGYQGIVRARRKVLGALKLRPSAVAPLLLISLLFVLVPLVQTLRLPYFSSMKALFYLPAVPAMLALLGVCCQRIFPDISRGVVCSIVLLNLVVGMLLLVPVICHLG